MNANQLWHWDSWFSDVALCQIMVEQGKDADKQEMLSYGRGCVLNFLSVATADGDIPIQIVVSSKSRGSRAATQPDSSSNMHKPVLAQQAAFLVKMDNGNADWLR